MSLDAESLPSGWTVAKVDDTGQYINGLAFKPEDWEGQGRPIIRIQNLTDIDKPFNRTTKEYPQEFIVNSGDILVSWSATLDAFLWHGETAILNQHIFKVVPNTNVTNERFLYYLLRYAIEQMKKTDHLHGSTMKHINRNPFLDHEIPLPPRTEQTRIVEEIEKQFSRLDAGVAALKRVQANLKRYRASVLKAACEGRLVPTEAELARQEGRDYEPADVLLQRILKERRERWEAEQLAKLEAQGRLPLSDTWKTKYTEPTAPDTSKLPELPEGWCWARSEQLCEFITKGTTPSKEKLFSAKGEVPYIKVYNLTHRGTLDFSVNPTFIGKSTHRGELNRSIVHPGDVLMNIVGPPLGKVSIVPEQYPEWNINQAIAIFRAMPSFNRKYLSHCLLSNDILRWAITRSKATAGQFNLTLEICRDLPLPLPPQAEQKRIVAEVERRLSVVEEIEKTVAANLKRAERMRQAILQRAFSGKLVPQDPNDEPASVLLECIRAEREAKAMPPRKSVTPKAKPIRQMAMNLVE